MANEILIIDDEPDIRTLVKGVLEDEHYTTREATNTQNAWEEINKRSPSAIILDIWLEGSDEDGMSLLRRIKRDYPQLPVIMISGHGNIDTAVEAIRLGAYDFIEKPFKADRLLVTLKRALDAYQLKLENQDLQRRTGGNVTTMIGQSDAAQTLRELIDKVGPTNSRVLLTGPAGSGKEVAARLLHQKSKRASQPFVVLNCATLRPQDLEEELFGWEDKSKGSERKVGLLERAHGGTLFLDEIADMPLETQAKMVRVLQDQRFERVGSLRAVEVDVRFMGASNRNLAQLMTLGKFRQDLYYRLNVVPMAVPSLHDRVSDIPLLVDYFLDQQAQAAGIKRRAFAPDTMAALQAYAWPSNVRQLRNLVEWLLIATAQNPEHEPIRLEKLPPEFKQTMPTVAGLKHSDAIMRLPLRDARELFEKEYLQAQMTRFTGNISRTAQFIGMERSALHRKLKQLGLDNARDDEEEMSDVAA